MSNPNPMLFWMDQRVAEPGYQMLYTEITLRDLFAAFCAAGLNANSDFTEGTCKGAAEIAYRLADALLAAREREDTE